MPVGMIGKKAVIYQRRLGVALLISALYLDKLMVVILDAVNQLGKSNLFVGEVVVAIACINFLFVFA